MTMMKKREGARNEQEEPIVSAHLPLPSPASSLPAHQEVHDDIDGGGGGGGGHDEAAEGDALISAEDSGVQFVAPLLKKDPRSDKALMRRLHG